MHFHGVSALFYSFNSPVFGLFSGMTEKRERNNYNFNIFVLELIFFIALQKREKNNAVFSNSCFKENIKTKCVRH